MEISVSIT